MYNNNNTNSDTNMLTALSFLIEDRPDALKCVMGWVLIHKN